MKKDTITTYSADTATGGVLSGARSYAGKIKAERREALLAALILGAGFGAAALKILEVAGITSSLIIDSGTREVVILSVALYGTIQVPRLDSIRDTERLVLMMLHAGMLLIYIPEITPNFGIVASVALGMLFVSSLVNAITSDADTAKMMISEHASQLGAFGGGMAAVIGFL